MAALYQLTQFMIFVATAVVFGILHQRPMNEPEALFHGLPTLLLLPPGVRES